MIPIINDAIVFHSTLNPKIWGDQYMRPEVRDDLLLIMEDFKDFLGVNDLDIVDITVSGSNAAYTYTPHSDIDLHLVVNIPEDQDVLYTELFDAKKNLYNVTRNIKVRGYDVELYVQDSRNPVQSMGLYSVLYDKWIDYPKRVKAQVDDLSVLAKVEAYTARLKEAIESPDLVYAKSVWADYRDMRKAGLDREGEFSPENLAFKILRTQGLAKDLFDHIVALKDRELSLEQIEEQNRLAKKKITELFDNSHSFTVVSSTSKEYVIKSQISNRWIYFSAEKADDLDGKTVWEIVFYEKSKVGKWEFDMTGSGGEFDVMGFIMQGLKQFISEYAPDIMRFTADKTGESDSRARVYDAMLKRYMPAGYEIKTSDTSRRTNFWIEKK